ncbi:unnamed protein product [Pipistrellus nathusii]|uniref:Uncharacterized protein n=1 Tax=Pipistrellus nathusii TaxID=59473 RepID=A0ABN9Z5K0_PIPNA
MTAVLHKLFPSPLSKIPNLLTSTENENKTKYDLILKIAFNRENIGNIWSPPASRPLKMSSVTMVVDRYTGFLTKLLLGGKIDFPCSVSRTRRTVENLDLRSHVKNT